MPQIEPWDNLPEGVRQHLIERMRDRAICVGDLNQLQLWVAFPVFATALTHPEEDGF